MKILLIVVVARGRTAFNLLAVWAFHHRNPVVTPNSPATEAAVEHYRPFLAPGPAIMAGDFNASVIWDKGGRYGSETVVLRPVSSRRRPLRAQLRPTRATVPLRGLIVVL